jgi:predicted O-methyltransferase YrrM
MLHNIPPRILKRMRYLERLDAQHRRRKVRHFDRLRQIPPATGKLLALLAAGAPRGRYLEIGTSGGYSTLWLSLACSENGRKLTTFEISNDKARLARETFRVAGIEDMIELVKGDARRYLKGCKDVAFCFLDAEKTHYGDCYEMVVPNLVPGGLLVADNVLSHQETLAPMVRRALRDSRVDSLILPVGSGELLCRRI